MLTYLRVMFASNAFFAAMPREDGSGKAWRFALSIVFLTAGAMTIQNIFLEENLQLAVTLSSMIVWALMLCVHVLCIHGFCLLFGAREPIRASFNLVCYAQAVLFISLAPEFGPYLAYAYMLVLLAKAIRQVQYLSLATSVLIALTPVLLMSVLLFFI